MNTIEQAEYKATIGEVRRRLAYLEELGKQDDSIPMEDLRYIRMAKRHMKKISIPDEQVSGYWRRT